MKGKLSAFLALSIFLIALSGVTVQGKEKEYVSNQNKQNSQDSFCYMQSPSGGEINLSDICNSPRSPASSSEEEPDYYDSSEVPTAGEIEFSRRYLDTYGSNPDGSGLVIGAYLEDADILLEEE